MRSANVLGFVALRASSEGNVGGLVADLVNRPLSLLLWLILLAASGHATLGQVSSVYGSLRVSVADTSGAEVPNCSVTVKLSQRNWSRSALTTSSGVSYFPALTPGDYVVSVALNGFEPQEVAVKIMLGHEAVVQFSLRPAGPRDKVTVTAAASEGVDSHTIPIHTHVNATEIQGLPINQRNFLDFALLDSAVQRDTLRVHAVAGTSGFNVTGQRPRSNSLQLDGADLNDETTGGVRGGVPMEAVQEFQVLTSGYQAEYGRASGGVVNVITTEVGTFFLIILSICL